MRVDRCAPKLPLHFVNPAYRKNMAEANKVDFENSAHILDEEDEATLALLKQRVKTADEGRLVTSEEVHQRMKKWLTKSSAKKTR